MKVLMINVVCGIRSTGRICTDIADALTAQGHEVKIAYGRETVPEKYQKYAVRIGSDFGVKLHGLRARLFDGAGFGSKSDTRKFIEWVKEYNPDVIHLHNLHGYYINMEVLFDYLRICEKKIIWTLHDCWAFTGHCCYFDYVQCQQWRNGCEKCVQHHSYPYSWVDNSKRNFENKKALFLSLQSCTVVTPSKWLANYVKESFLGSFSCKVIRNGIDQNIFRPIKSIDENSCKKPTILCVANIWEERKGWRDVVELSNVIGNDAMLIVVGVNQKQESELSNRTLVIEKTESVTTLAKLYQNATVFFNPTYEDNYPTVNLEAISCGTPIVTYQTGGSPEVLELGHFGWTIQPGDYKSLIAITNKVFDLNESIEVEDTHMLSNEHMAKEYLGLYSQI